MSNAILFGSISTIADTSELQRKAFNQAFKQHGLDWNWPQDEYQSLLQSSGGRSRIAAYARSKGQEADADAIHQTKSELFQAFLDNGELEPRPGVADIIRQAKAEGLALAFVSTTSQENIASILDALKQSLSASDFDIVTSADDVAQSKPAKDAYRYVLEQLNQAPDHCIAIEDNVDGVKAAIAADIPCIAFPNQNTANHHFSGAERTIQQLDFAQIQILLRGKVAA